MDTAGLRLALAKTLENGISITQLSFVTPVETSFFSVFTVLSVVDTARGIPTVTAPGLKV